jgi:hypothetical protein
MMATKSNDWAARRYEICRLKYLPSEKRFLQLEDGGEAPISAQEIARLYTVEALEMLGACPNTWCVIMEEDEEESETDASPILIFDPYEDYLAWRRSLLPALILRGPAWTA